MISFTALSVVLSGCLLNTYRNVFSVNRKIQFLNQVSKYM